MYHTKLLISCIYLITPILSQNILLETQCSNFTYDACAFGNNAIIDGFNVPDAYQCQAKCRNTNECLFFHFDFWQKYCYVLRSDMNEYLETCGKFAGPDLPDTIQCNAEVESNQCLTIRNVFCTPLGNHLENLQEVSSMEICQKACQVVELCDYFRYDLSTLNCQLVQGQDVMCDALIGPKSPSIEECEGGNYTTIATTTTTSTTTTWTTTTSPTTTRPKPLVTLKILVVDALNGHKLKMVWVEVIDNGQISSDYTDSHGRVSFGPYLADKTLSISLEFYGYMDKNMEVDLTEQQIDVNNAVNLIIPLVRGEKYLEISCLTEVAEEDSGLVELHVMEVDSQNNVICDSSRGHETCYDVDFTTFNSDDDNETNDTILQEMVEWNSDVKRRTFIYLYYDKEENIVNSQVEIKGSSAVAAQKNLELYFKREEAKQSQYWLIGCLQSPQFADFHVMNRYSTSNPKTNVKDLACTISSRGNTILHFSSINFFLQFFLLLLFLAQVNW